MKAARCAECDGPLVQPTTGRPRTYCGPVCRRAAEYDLRRSQGLLLRAQRAEQDACLRVTTADDWAVKREQKVLDFWRDEVARLRGELRGLLLAVTEGAQDSVADHKNRLTQGDSA